MARLSRTAAAAPSGPTRKSRAWNYRWHGRRSLIRLSGTNGGNVMTGHILVAYATKHGSTREVAEAVAGTREQRGVDVDVLPAASAGSLDGYDGVVLGGALYTGRWH